MISYSDAACVVLSAFSGIFLVWQLLKIYYPIISEDISTFKALLQSFLFLTSMKKKKWLINDCLAEKAKAHPNQNFIIYDREKWTFQEMHRWVNQHARVFHKMGLKPFNKIGLMMMNEPAFVAVWGGASANGVTSAFINYQLCGKSLLHCLTIAEAKMFIIGNDASIVQAVTEIKKDLDKHHIKVYTYGKVLGCPFDNLTDLVEKESFEDVPREWRGKFSVNDSTCYIYTSGTTGLPKAVNFSTERAWKAASVGLSMKISKDDVIYTPLPLYHAAATTFGFSMALAHGCSMVLRKKFSASQLWPDCRKYNVTIVQYIGETMRYVCAQPPTDEDRNHCVRAVIGNGLRPDVWKILLDRYGEHIHVFELYAATEGNIGFINLFNKFGCVGTLSPFYQLVTGAYVVKFDSDAEEIKRDKNGRAILADWNEPGLVIGQIKKNFEISSYKGAEKLTNKKILLNVFKKGDQYFNSGDLMMRDKNYCMHFCDRVGDTYRWKGENVSTNEVGDILSAAPQIYMANVYGVEVPGNEGRAGMVALILNEGVKTLNGAELYKFVCNSLPHYSRPLFLRVDRDLEVTGTFKLKKVALKSQGFDPKLCENAALYVIDHKLKTYTPITIKLNQEIKSGKYRL